MRLFKKIAITTGDKNGIGLEVAAKALSSLSAKERKQSVFFVFRDHGQDKLQRKFFDLIDKKYLRLTFTDFEKSLVFVNLLEKSGSLPKNVLIDLKMKTSAAEWVVLAGQACSIKKINSMVTGPLSKTLTAALPSHALGHTGVFRHMFPKAHLHMSFIGKNFNVLLATDHMPLAKTESSLKKTGLGPALKAATNLRKILKSKKKIAVLGYNPHAGEKGLIGATEKILFGRLPRNVEGPLVPDAAFLKKNWNRYCVFVCLYHDQGLIPFKMQHGQDSGVHLTLGLPFLRTSVDHGTAVDLFNKNIANPKSMLEAIRLNIQLIGV